MLVRVAGANGVLSRTSYTVITVVLLFLVKPLALGYAKKLVIAGVLAEYMRRVMCICIVCGFIEKG